MKLYPFIVLFLLLDAANRLKRKAVEALAVDQVLGKPTKPRKLAAGASSGSDLFELPPLPEHSQIGDTVSDNYYELPIHQVLYSGDLDLSEVCAQETFTLIMPCFYDSLYINW